MLEMYSLLKTFKYLIISTLRLLESLVDGTPFKDSYGRDILIIKDLSILLFNTEAFRQSSEKHTFRRQLC